jgi:hypothetical protein
MAIATISTTPSQNVGFDIMLRPPPAPAAPPLLPANAGVSRISAARLGSVSRASAAARACCSR